MIMSLSIRRLQRLYGITPHKEWGLGDDLFKYGTKVGDGPPKQFREFQFVDVVIVRAKIAKALVGITYQYKDPELRKKYAESYGLDEWLDVEKDPYSNQIVRIGSEFDGRIVKSIRESKFGTKVIVTFDRGKSMSIDKDRIGSLKRLKEACIWA
jgi:hypothetical protein